MQSIATLPQMLQKIDWPLAGLLLLGLAVRIWGITWQLPWLLYADEYYYSAGALRMWAAQDPDPHYFINPGLSTYWLAALYMPLRGALALFSIPDGSALLGVFLIGRLTSAALGTATIWAVYLLGRIMFDRPVALLSGAFLALDFLHAPNSHYATTDVPAFRLLVIAGLISGTSFLATTPFALLDWPAFFADFRHQYELGSTLWFGQATRQDPLLLYLLSLMQAMRYVQVLLVVLGLGIGLLRRDRWALLLLAFPFAYLLFMATKELFFVRFALPVLPPLCLLAARGGEALVTNLASIIRRRGVAFVFALISLLQSAVRIVQHNLLITRVLASRWAMEHLAGKGAIAIYEYSWDGGLLSLPKPVGDWPSGGLELTAAEPQTNTQISGQPQPDAYRFLVVSSFVQDARRLTFLAGRRAWPDTLERWLNEEEALGSRLATFTPGIDGGSIPYRLDDTYTPFWNLNTWVRPGPTIKIYELHR